VEKSGVLIYLPRYVTVLSVTVNVKAAEYTTSQEK
jgi:hypothetical protein